MKVKSESEFAQLCPTLSDPMDCSLPGTSIHGIFQASILEWAAIVAAAQIKPELLRQPSHTPATARHCTPSPARLPLLAGTLTLHPDGLVLIRSLPALTCPSVLHQAFPGSSDGKESACNVGDPGSIPGLGRSPGGGHSNPLQSSCLENPVDRGAWRATVCGISKSQT